MQIDQELETVNAKKATTHFVNVKFTTENAEYSPKAGLAVNNKAGDAQLKLLDYLVEHGSTATLKIALNSISIGGAYDNAHVEDPLLDMLLGTQSAESAPLIEDVKKYEPALFWINTDVTSTHLEEPDGSEGVIRTSGISIDKTAPRQFLSDLLKVLNDDNAELLVEITSVRHVKPLNNTKLKDLNFL